ncbi:MAG: methionyl aminopeptidase [Lachnospiraceae bacterium]|nr:methionyl aminopeptidase [Lachnospiraceae bacterium]
MKIGRNSPCWCLSGKKYKQCHEAFDNKLMSLYNRGFDVPDHDMIKVGVEIEGIKKSAKINMACLDAVAEVIDEGMTTQDIDDIVSSTTKKMGGICAPLNYDGFPKSVCTSVNDQVCHGIPSKDVVLKSGDIINVDCTTIFEGYYADSSRMFLIGDVDEDKKKLVEVTKECCDLGLKQVKPWEPIGNIGAVIKEHAHKNGYTVVREIGGHGVGIDFHEEPWVSYVTNMGEGMIMAPGMMFTIEPMINMGTHSIKTDPINNWEVSTIDGKPSAQWEYQVLVTEDGYEMISW